LIDYQPTGWRAAGFATRMERRQAALERDGHIENMTFTEASRERRMSNKRAAIERWLISDQEMLRRLRELYEASGHLSAVLIGRAPDVPGPATYIKRFGSLMAAYRQVGFAPSHHKLRGTNGRYLAPPAMADRADPSPSRSTA
jgi:hypothetical protein